ncbi:hypothetical protein AVL50_19875 [Flammeovirga sp. SJP92]|nr:hypothetical protein AVL50_19875 [Flammeovirga sp. SJP92]
MKTYFIKSSFTSGANFSRIIFETRANFTEAKFNFETNFSDSEFNSLAIFFNSKFCSTSTFSDCKFHSETNFFNVGFDSLIDFTNVEFDSSITFFGGNFNSIAIFKKSIFKSNAKFSEARFKSSLDFSEADFRSEVVFTGTKFNSTVNFSKTKFKSKLNFFEAKFDSSVNFCNSEFDSTVDFSEVSVNGKIIFDYIILPDSLIFDHFYSNDIIDLSLARLQTDTSRCVINLSATNIEKFKFDYSQGFVLDKDSLKNYTVTVSVYEQLMKMQKRYGYTSGYEKADKEKKKYIYFEKAKHGPWKFVKNMMLNFLDRYWWDYGYNKTLVFKNVILIFFFFYFINIIYSIPYSYSFKNRVLRKRNVQNKLVLTYDMKPIDFLLKSKKRWVRYGYYTLLYTAFIFFGLKMDFKEIKYHKIGNAFLIYFQYAVGLICLAYLANTIIIG